VELSRTVQEFPRAWIGGSWINIALATSLWCYGARQLGREGEMQWHILGDTSSQGLAASLSTVGFFVFFFCEDAASGLK